MRLKKYIRMRYKQPYRVFVSFYSYHEATGNTNYRFKFRVYNRSQAMRFLRKWKHKIRAAWFVMHERKTNSVIANERIM